ncbi:AAA family ATPase [Vibrio sp. Isolate30]|uniref:AAA family ATPase n=1 Tax=Vibrio sp. Isolate30 TaxID=2908536 RepID=UPI001EFE8807|nr:AAA family ATPase [Vibrio sp. Isolate30]MCG9630157.1 AAA family ATPase [Vibrio sp. Isolate30]
MLEKIIKIENIKQWQHKGGLNQSFDKLNLIYGRNGTGKSTLCKLFESINRSDKASIEALQPIESQDKQRLQLKVTSQNITLDSLQSPFTFQVFNQTFIDNNLYISNSKDRKQLANYYEFSLGNVSVEKEKDIDQLKSTNDGITSLINPITSRLSAKFPGKTPAVIRKIKEIKDPDQKIADLESKIQDLKSEEHFKKRRRLTELKIEQSEFDTSVFDVNIAAISKDAEEKVKRHIEENQKEQDKLWIESGLKLVTETNNCPFCAQSLSSSPIFNLYQEFISESYLTASSNFELESDSFELTVRDVGLKIEQLEKTVQSNQEILNEWSDRIEAEKLNFDLSEFKKLSDSLLSECQRLIKEKKKDLLKSVDLSTFNDFLGQIFNRLDFATYNEKVVDFNSKVDLFINGLATGTTQALQTNIDEIKEAKLRFTNDVVTDLADLKTHEADKKENDKKIKSLRDEITKEQEESIKSHKDSINDILQSFHSMIRIKELDKDNRGAGGKTRLKYVITFINNELSVLDEGQHQHIFEHVLSLGDRSALALAFFLSRFSKSNDDKSIIILDDPMSSLDSYRKDATIVQIAKLIENDYQTFVFSHDPFFLSDIHKHSILSKYTKCFEIAPTYRDLEPLNSDSPKYISSKMVDRDSYESYVLHSYHREYNKLYDFVESGNESDKIEVARSIRPVLEAYLRFSYPKQFIKGIWLGDMIKMIREETDPSSIFFDKNKKFEAIAKINEFSKAYHHAEDFDTKIQDLELETVRFYAKETVQFITGL